MENIHEVLHKMEHHLNLQGHTGKRSPARADYGQDVPLFTLLIFIIGLVFSSLAGFTTITWGASLPTGILTGLLATLGLAGIAAGAFLVWASRSGKYLMRDRILADIPFRGDEQVLDVGCGAGLLLIGAAKRLTSGKATGVDIWDKNLEYGSNPENVWANARLEGVAERIEVKDGNACRLPFEDGSFDLVMTSDMLHHMSAADRARGLSEMARVLKPGGRLEVAEIAFTKQIMQTLAENGLSDIREAPLDMVLWHRIIATK